MFLKHYLIFVILFCGSCPFQESLGCVLGYMGHVNRSYFPKITMNLDMENVTPDYCKEGGPCGEQTDCGENGECIPNWLKFKIG